MKKKKSHIVTKRAGRVLKIDTGLDVLEFGAPDGIINFPNPVLTTYSVMDVVQICNDFRSGLAEFLANTETTGHHRTLGHAVGLYLDQVQHEVEIAPGSYSASWPKEIHQDFRHIVKEALLAGYYCARMRLIPAERPAWAAKQSIKGARKGGKNTDKRPRTGSVRDVLESEYPGWRKENELSLARKLRLNSFPSLSLDNLRRSIKAAKKVGG